MSLPEKHAAVSPELLVNIRCVSLDDELPVVWSFVKSGHVGLAGLVNLGSRERLWLGLRLRDWSLLLGYALLLG